MLTISQTDKPIFFQNSNDGTATFAVSGESNSDVTLTFTPLQYGEILKVSVPKNDKNFYAKNVKLKAGDYTLKIENATETRNISPVCVGEVLVWTGHSFADGYGCLAENNKSAYYSENFWERRDENAFLKPDFPLSFRNNATTEKRRGLAGRIASKLADQLKVPVMMYLCNWGGTNIIQWANSADGREVQKATGYAGYRAGFENIGYPYRILGETLKNFVPKTGARGLLIIHGDNDKGNSYNEQLDCYARLFRKIRNDAAFPNFSISLAKSCNDLGKLNVLEAIQKIINLDPNNSLGCEVTDNTINKKFRYDGLHLNEEGEDIIAAVWVEGLIRSNFFQKTPILQNYKLVEETLEKSVNRPVQIITTAYAAKIDRETKNSYMTMIIVFFALALLSLIFRFKAAIVLSGTGISGGISYLIQKNLNDPNKI